MPVLWDVLEFFRRLKIRFRRKNSRFKTVAFRNAARLAILQAFWKTACADPDNSGRSGDSMLLFTVLI
jgi:hypothetical protein